MKIKKHSEIKTDHIVGAVEIIGVFLDHDGVRTKDGVTGLRLLTKDEISAIDSGAGEAVLSG